MKYQEKNKLLRQFSFLFVCFKSSRYLKDIKTNKIFFLHLLSTISNFNLIFRLPGLSCSSGHWLSYQLINSEGSIFTVFVINLNKCFFKINVSQTNILALIKIKLVKVLFLKLKLWLSTSTQRYDFVNSSFE